jgi:hypothetical protein
MLGYGLMQLEPLKMQAQLLALLVLPVLLDHKALQVKLDLKALQELMVQLVLLVHKVFKVK